MEKSPTHILAHPQNVSSLGLNPFPWYRYMRKANPIHFNTQINGWDFFRYDDILHIMRHPEIFSPLVQDGEMGGNLLQVNPYALQVLVSHAFTPRAIVSFNKHTAEIVDTLLDKGQETRQLDLITDLASPLSMIVLAEMLGIPVEERDQFKQVVSGPLAGAEATLQGYFRMVLQQRRREQEDDLISKLLWVHLDGKALSEDELLAFCIQLLVAGSETITNLIGNAVLCFDGRPDAVAELRQDLSLLPVALEEVARFRSPVQRFSRIARQDTEIDGRQIKAGQRLFCWVGAANRDATWFSNPETFSIRRTPNHHLGFGNGVHFCLGALLARKVTRIAFERLLTRFRNIQLNYEQPLQPITSISGYGVEHLAVRVALA